MMNWSIIFLFSIFWSSSSVAELTTSDETQSSAVNGAEPRSTSICAEVETQFQGHILKVLEGAEDGFSRSYQCLIGGVQSRRADCTEINSKNLGELKEYRASLKKAYQEIADKWVAEESRRNQGYTRNCLGSPVQFERNIRRVRAKLDPSICQAVVTSWSHNLDRLAQEYFDGKRELDSLTNEELARLNSFHKSPLKRIISTNALFDSELNDQALKQRLAAAFNTMKFGTEKLKEKVGNFKDHEKYKLFDFQNQFSLFTASLPQSQRGQASSCIERSGFFRDCTINILEQGSRCGSRLWGLGRDLLPVIPLIDSIGGMGEVMAAEASGAMTAQEATAKRIELSTKAAVGVVGVASLGGSLAKGVVAKLNQIGAFKPSPPPFITTGRGPPSGGINDAASSFKPPLSSASPKQNVVEISVETGNELSPANLIGKVQGNLTTMRITGNTSKGPSTLEFNYGRLSSLPKQRRNFLKRLRQLSVRNDGSLEEHG